MTADGPDPATWLRQAWEKRRTAAADTIVTNVRWYDAADLDRSHHAGGAGLADFDSRFIAAHGPGYALAVADMALTILEEHIPAERAGWCRRCVTSDPADLAEHEVPAEDVLAVESPCPTLKALAWPVADDTMPAELR